MIYACKNHHQILMLWRQRQLPSLKIAHIDFHDDLRGLFIERKLNLAYPIKKLARKKSEVDDGNFLAHAVLEGRLAKIRWIHFKTGGRAFDLGIVRYPTDLFAQHHRARQLFFPHKTCPLIFDEILMENWNGIETGEALSLDWDCFASTLLEFKGINQRVEMFLNRIGSQIPTDTYMAYSPSYVHPSLTSFQELATRLANRFQQEINWLSPDLTKGDKERADADLLAEKTLWQKMILTLRRIGIY